MDQIKSMQRVADHGEVFTSEREVNDMLDLVKQETERIDSHFLEPACGNGNFLIEVLRRKMEVVLKNYRQSQYECEKYLVVAVGSIYGIDLLEDNIQECRSRLFDLFQKRYRQSCKSYCSEQFESVISFILEKNVVCGDALTMKDLYGEPIMFSEWSVFKNQEIKRRVFSFSELLETRGKQTSIFDAGWTAKEKKAQFVPNPVKDYPAVHYMELINYD